MSGNVFVVSLITLIVLAIIGIFLPIKEGLIAALFEMLLYANIFGCIVSGILYFL